MKEKLDPAELSLLYEAERYGEAKASTDYERQLIAGLVIRGYLTSSDRITLKGLAALRKQGD